MLSTILAGGSLQVYADEGVISDAEVRVLVETLSLAVDSEAAWSLLTEEEQKAVIERGLGVSEVKQLPSDEQMSLAGGCWIADKSFGAYSHAGVHLFSFGQRIHWCDNGSQVTSTYNRTPLPATHAPFWYYRGIVGDLLTPTPAFEITSYYQGFFEICYPQPVGCVEQRYPWVRFLLRPNGSWTWEKPAY